MIVEFKILRDMSETNSRTTNLDVQKSTFSIVHGSSYNPMEDCPGGQRKPEGFINLQSRSL